MGYAATLGFFFAMIVVVVMLVQRAFVEHRVGFE
jgi:hypothetical protein